MVFLHILIVLSLLTVLISLVMGTINMRKTDEQSHLKANKLMRIRVAAQFIAVIALVLLVWLKTKGGVSG